VRTSRISSRATAVPRRRRGTRQTSGNLRLSCSPCRGRNRSSIPESGCVARCTSCRESVSGMWRWRSSGPSLLFYASGETREGGACTCRKPAHQHVFEAKSPSYRPLRRRGSRVCCSGTLRNARVAFSTASLYFFRPRRLSVACSLLYAEAGVSSFLVHRVLCDSGLFPPPKVMLLCA